MNREDLEAEIFRYEDEYADLCEFNNFSETDSDRYLKKIDELKKKLKALESNRHVNGII